MSAEMTDKRNTPPEQTPAGAGTYSLYAAGARGLRGPTPLRRPDDEEGRIVIRLSWVLAVLVLLVATASGQVARHPPNAQAVSCLLDPEMPSSWDAPFQTTEIESVRAGSVRVRFTLTNRCVTRLSVSGLEPATPPGGSIEEGAAIEVAVISDDSTEDGEPQYLLAGTGFLGVFDVPAGATVTREVVVQLTVGTTADVVAATAWSFVGRGGWVRIGDLGNHGDVTGIGVRSVCVHYADRPCGAYQ